MLRCRSGGAVQSKEYGPCNVALPHARRRDRAPLGQWTYHHRAQRKGSFGGDTRRRLHVRKIETNTRSLKARTEQNASLCLSGSGQIADISGGPDTNPRAPSRQFDIECFRFTKTWLTRTASTQACNNHRNLRQAGRTRRVNKRAAPDALKGRGELLLAQA